MDTKPQKTNLWPDDLLSNPPSSPVELLRTQADLLSKLTQQRLRGEIVTRTEGDMCFSNVHTSSGDQKVLQLKRASMHSLELRLPTLDYRYELLWLGHDPAKEFPVVLGGAALGDQLYRVDNESELIDRLRRALSSSHTRRVIASLVDRTPDSKAS